MVDSDYHAKDIVKCYTNCVLDMVENYPVFSVFDSVVSYDGSDIRCGEYLMNVFKSIPYLLYFCGD